MQKPITNNTNDNDSSFEPLRAFLKSRKRKNHIVRRGCAVRADPEDSIDALFRRLEARPIPPPVVYTFSNEKCQKLYEKCRTKLCLCRGSWGDGIGYETYCLPTSDGGFVHHSFFISGNKVRHLVHTIHPLTEPFAIFGDGTYLPDISPEIDLWDSVSSLRIRHATAV